LEGLKQDSPALETKEKKPLLSFLLAKKEELKTLKKALKSIPPIQQQSLLLQLTED